MPFYLYRQNNSGGEFDYDPVKGISVEVYVEADSASEADDKATEIGIYFDGVDDDIDCDCCGDRWSRAWNYDVVNEVPEEDSDFSKGSFTLKWMENGDYEAFVHLKDGSFYGALK